MGRAEKERGILPQSNWARLRLLAIVALIGIICAAIGCTKVETGTEPATDYGIKNQVKLKLDLRLKGVAVRKGNCNFTKAAVNDQLIEDINIYVTNEVGDIVYYSYHQEETELNIDAFEKMHYTVYAIANAGKKLIAKNEEEIKNLSYSITNSTSIKSADGAVLMSGCSEPQLLNGTTTITLYLTRCISKIVVKADFTQLYNDVEIKVNSIKLKNIPNTINIFRENKTLTAAGSIDGDALYNITQEELKNGITFYQFENMQGTLQPQNTLQQQKQWPQESIYSKICSYIELNATYSSPRKYGEILYRFYLGSDMLANYDIKRNTQLNITISFIKDGAIEENNWRVDSSEIMDLVTSVTLSPSSIKFSELGESKQIIATVLPATASMPELEWSSTDSNVAEVDNNGNVTSAGNGECTIYATTTDGTEITASCNIKVEENIPDIPENHELSFTTTTGEMYDGEKRILQFSVCTATADKISAISSNNSIIKVLGVSEDGVTVEAIAPGSAVITAKIGESATTECTIEVEKLTITAAEEILTLYNHFYEETEYEIFPKHAAKDFKVAFTTNADEIKTEYEGIGNRIMPQFEEGAALPAKYTLKLTLEGRPDVFDEVELTVKPMLQMVSSLSVNANWGNSTVVKNLELDVHPRANVQMSWEEADGVKFYGNPGEGDVEIFTNESKILFPIPNSANGLYRLNATVTGDDGYGGDTDATDSQKHCDITIYETVYLVGVSKTMDRNKVAGTTDTWEYENEIVAKWYSHPNSLMYPQGLIDLELPFSYNGKTYTENYTGETEIFTFTFEKGEKLNMALGSGEMTYNGTPPLYYLEYFKLEPAGTPYIKGNPATGEPYLFIYSRHFTSGFSKIPSPDWEKIFKLIYP